MALDEAECRALARNRAVSASLGKKRVVRGVFAESFTACMAGRGWSRGQDAAAPPVPETSLAPGLVSGLGLAFEPPAGYSPAASDTGVAGPGAWKRHILESPGGESLVLVFQRSAKDIPVADFPVPGGYRVYDRGYAGGLEWVAFTGEQAGVTVACFGTYVPAGDRERVIVTVAAPLPRTGGPPPSENLALNAWQRVAVESLIREWSDWLSANPTGAPGRGP